MKSGQNRGPIHSRGYMRAHAEKKRASRHSPTNPVFPLCALSSESVFLISSTPEDLHPQQAIAAGCHS
jgi:hypothetical protein